MPLTLIKVSFRIVVGSLDGTRCGSIPQRTADGTLTAATRETTGHIYPLRRQLRPAVAFVFAGARRGRGKDLARVSLGVAGLCRSANWALLQAGLVYPTSYSKPYLDLRTAMATVAAGARGSGSGVWAQDVTCNGFTLRSRLQLKDDLVRLPRLALRHAWWRRATLTLVNDQRRAGGRLTTPTSRRATMR